MTEPSGAGTSTRVVVADDHETFRAGLIALLQTAPGVEVVGEAATGEAGLDVVRDAQPDVVLMDVNLPGIDGVEAARRLRERPSPPVVLLLSTYDEDAGAQFVAESGASAYVTKSSFGCDRLREAWAAASA